MLFLKEFAHAQPAHMACRHLGIEIAENTFRHLDVGFDDLEQEFCSAAPPRTICRSELQTFLVHFRRVGSYPAPPISALWAVLPLKATSLPSWKIGVMTVVSAQVAGVDPGIVRQSDVAGPPCFRRVSLEEATHHEAHDTREARHAKRVLGQRRAVGRHNMLAKSFDSSRTVVENDVLLSADADLRRRSPPCGPTGSRGTRVELGGAGIHVETSCSYM